MSAREAILDRVRRAQRTARLPSAPTFAGAIRDRAPADRADRLERFLIESRALGVTTYVERTRDAVHARVAEIVGDAQTLRWDPDRLPYDCASALINAVDGAAPRAVQAAAAIGVTGCDAAIAETGSLALITGRGKPRAASLLPPVHLAIVRLAQLRFSMGEFFAERAGEIAAAANCTFVTVPSRTADIELTLTLGVHGPGAVIVVIGP
jgi:L-lactate dehydrogenase complex protein LldG